MCSSAIQRNIARAKSATHMCMLSSVCQTVKAQNPALSNSKSSRCTFLHCESGTKGSLAVDEYTIRCAKTIPLIQNRPQCLLTRIPQVIVRTRNICHYI
jgi:hypothetical protein